MYFNFAASRVFQVGQLNNFEDQLTLICVVQVVWRAFCWSPLIVECFLWLFLGTTIVMYYENDVIYRIHLHPGREHDWSEVLLRASSTVCITIIICKKLQGIYSLLYYKCW